MNFNKENQSVLVLLYNEPQLSDPLEYDDFISHVAFTSVNGNLVSQYKLGEHTPELAQSWTVNPNYTEWTFSLRPEITFSDGSPITGQIVLSNWLRMAKIMKSKKSESGFFEYLLGYESLTSQSKSIAGLTATNSSITIKLTKSLPSLLDKISFGLYSIVHPSHYNEDGLWIAKKDNLKTSGPYTVTNWDNDKLTLSLRQDYPKNLIHPKPIQKVKMVWSKKIYPNKMIDLVLGSDLIDPPDKKFKLQAAPPSSIYFVRVLSWKNPKSPFSNRSFRIAYRNHFYEQLEKLSINPIRSFFPLIIKNINELQDFVPTSNNFTDTHVKLPIYPPRSKVGNGIGEALTNVAKINDWPITEIEFSSHQLFQDITSNSNEKTWDLSSDSTGILASAPLDDVKFMFKSKEGILLPDETGEILAELEKDNPDLQKINQLLWEQGLIWPVTHYSSGLWANPDLDFSEINLVLPPTSFQWIGWK
ncbi:MAG: ABC transporter substrate-binding protein [Pseudobdellovibrio sp.]